MKKAIAAVVGSMILLTGAARADEILEVHADNMVGGGFGGLSGFMLGAVAGPIGALTTELDHLRRALRSGDAAALDHFFAAARDWSLEDPGSR